MTPIFTPNLRSLTKNQKEFIDGCEKGEHRKVQTLLLEGVRASCLVPDLLHRLVACGHLTQAMRVLKANPAIEHYQKTGEIADELLPFFDQNGRWVKSFTDDFEASGFGKLRQARIDKNRAIAKDNQGKIHLRTSFVEDHITPFSFDYVTIAGDIKANFSGTLFAPYLTKVEGAMSIKSIDKLSAPQLTHVCGEIYLPTAKEIFTPRLTKVSGDLKLNNALKIDLPELLEISGNFFAPQATEVLLTTLCKVGGEFHTPKAQRLLIPKLQWIGGSIQILPFNTKGKNTPSPFKSLKTQQLIDFEKSTSCEQTRQDLEEEIKRREKIQKISEKAQGQALTLCP